MKMQFTDKARQASRIRAAQAGMEKRTQEARRAAKSLEGRVDTAEAVFGPCAGSQGAKMGISGRLGIVRELTIAFGPYALVSMVAGGQR